MQRLGDLVNIKTGKLDANAANQDGLYPFFTCAVQQLRINIYAYDCECALVAGNGDLNVKYYNGKFNAYQRVYIIESIDKEILATKFLTRFLDTCLRSLRSKTKGAVIQFIRLGDLTGLKLVLPSLDEQIHIANILSKAENLINQRKESIHLLDEFTKSTFLEIFGDPVRNDHNWNTKRLDNISKLERGRFSPRPRNDPSYFNGEYPFIQTGDISKSGNRLNAYTQTLNEKGIKVSKKFGKGTIVIAIVGATIGATAILEIEVYATDSIIGITVKKELANNVFLEFVMQFWKPILLKNAPEAARANINLEILGKLAIIYPPIKIQTQFAQIVEKTETLKTKYQKSLLELENLYGSLSQKAFKGELTIK
jgi:type I restriction enzyme S subunit